VIRAVKVAVVVVMVVVVVVRESWKHECKQEKTNMYRAAARAAVHEPITPPPTTT
jgi:hypothetical protein